MEVDVPIQDPGQSLEVLDALACRGDAATLERRIAEVVQSGDLATLIELGGLFTLWNRVGSPGMRRPSLAPSFRDPATSDIMRTNAQGWSNWSGLLSWELSDGEAMEVPSVLVDSFDPLDRFLLRFGDRLRHGGCDLGFTWLIAAAFIEFLGNVMEHSQADVPGLASYQVSERRWCIGVGDVGQGVCASLRRNPAFAHLTSHVEALHLSLQDGVSGTGEKGRGHGYRPLFKALADRRVALRFRSGEARITWTGSGPTAQELKATATVGNRCGLFIRIEGEF